MNKRTIISVLLIAATVGWLCFIFGNSLKNFAESSEQSSKVCEVLQEAADDLGLDIKIKSSVIRTLAHFCEFAVLGVLFCADIIHIFIIPKDLSPIFLALSPALSLAAAVIDELLQKLSYGRVCDIKDVIVDFSGALLGAAVISAVFLLLKCRMSKKAAC